MSPTPPVYEKLGAFYLGRTHAKEQGEGALPTDTGDDGLLLYDSRDLLTHAMCVGMTGSGKTGLCVCLLEEAAIDRIPSLIIDPKGDLSNLLLTFPDLAAADFAPWINADEARRADLSPEEFAERESSRWREGLAEWQIDGERIRRLRETCDFAIYTPGSDAGRGISVLSCFSAPSQAVRDDADMFRDRVSTTVSSLLSLVDVDADPLRSREHILLANLLERSWQAGKGLDLAQLIQQVSTPPLERVGVMDIEAFFPEKDRFELAMALNSLLAAPSFAGWMRGEPLDVDRLLYTPEGKPRTAIFSISHLSDTERMFFVSLLLNETLGWLRSRPGTTSLRALLYMDEVFGYMPPVAEPPSKKPLLTLLKQARAFGLGVVLATQNPVDLDYKGLSNIGTWFLGRLQTERDKQRVLAGLESANESATTRISQREIDALLSQLPKRSFLMHNVHDDGPVVFQTRWAMSYLRGPLTRQQIHRLSPPVAENGSDKTEHVAGSTASAGAEATTVAADAAGSLVAATPPATSDEDADSGRPVVPPDVREVFFHADAEAPTYRPFVLGSAKVHFLDRSSDLEDQQEIGLLASLEDLIEAVDWADADPVDVAADELDTVLADEPADGACFLPLPKTATRGTSYRRWTKALDEHLYRTSRLTLLECRGLKVTARPSETEREFRIRLAEAAHERRDEEMDKLREDYGKKFKRLQERIRRAELAVDREEAEAQSAKTRGAISIGSTLLSAILGRKIGSSAATSARSASSAAKQMSDVRRAQEALDKYRADMATLEREFEANSAQVAAEIETAEADLTERQLKPRRTDIDIRLVALAWVPVKG
ncbi:MAG: ATP-binding protein [Planctomycetales bacterium]|nr:ATP-binding protein [Planctomycetales bacterium]